MRVEEKTTPMRQRQRETILERSTDMFYKFELTAKLALQVIVLRIQSLLRGLAE